MTTDDLKLSFANVCATPLPLPGRGRTAQRHLRLFEVARQDVSLAKLAEAHWDALAILADAQRMPVPGALYAVWASEVRGKPLRIAEGKLSGEKAFCTGFGLVDRALITVGGEDGRLLDLDVQPGALIEGSGAQWQVEAFRMTSTGSVRFKDLSVPSEAVIGEANSYLGRPGFWHGACGPAACWAGGAAGLLDFADRSRREDPHTLAHLAAMHANVWAMLSILKTAGDEIDAEPDNAVAAQRRALTVRHLIEQLATNTLQRFARSYGPVPLAMDEEFSRRYQEVDIFLRQCHGERDLEVLATLTKTK